MNPPDPGSDAALDADMVAALRARLLAERDELLAASRAAAEGRAPVTLDQQSVGRLSRMDALQGQAMAQAVEQRRALALKQIAATLARMDEGSYGECVICGEDIAPARLELDPKTPTCLACARRT